jgi:hypothetical protein
MAQFLNWRMVYFAPLLQSSSQLITISDKWSLPAMIKKLASALGLASILLSASAQALPIVQADAFTAGDNKAALETSTGLVWMDFGVNQHQSYSEVVSLLSNEYLGWRLPTAAEVDNLWTNLFDGLPEWNRYSQDFGYLSSYDHDDYFDQIFAIFGQSPDAEVTVTDNDTNLLLDSWTTKALFGVFAKESGVNGFVNLWQAYDDVHPNSALYIEMSSGVDISDWYGTLLVKDTITSVPEPSGLTLGLFLLLALVYRRKLAR